MATDNPKSHSPHIGQHSREILAELGMSAAEIEALLKDGAVAEAAMLRAAE
jgi:crotonobetainyl-CoA:carnitine CoA-transferase CaiB-like acyl-CoA transferase